MQIQQIARNTSIGAFTSNLHDLISPHQRVRAIIQPIYTQGHLTGRIFLTLEKGTMFNWLRRLFKGQRPQEQDTEPLPKDSLPLPSPPPPAPTQTKVDSPAQASEYLAKVQDKINRLAEEFASGAINQAQFQELFDHYRREQSTVKRWMEIAPDSNAWREATTEGKSVIIRTGNLARVLGYAVYENDSGMPLNNIGQFEADSELIVPMLSSYRAATKEIFGAGMRSSQIEGGKWLCFVPGNFTTLMALFSITPSARQMVTLEELHRLFERANRNLLDRTMIDPSELVFPHTYFLGRID